MHCIYTNNLSSNRDLSQVMKNFIFIFFYIIKWHYCDRFSCTLAVKCSSVLEVLAQARNH